MEISIFFKPLPNADEQYLILTLALARSGLSLLLSSWPTNSELAGSSPAAGASSTAPEPPEAAASKAVVLTVMIWRGVTIRFFFLFHLQPHLDGVGGLEGHDGVAGVDGPDEGVLVLDADDVADGAHVELGGQPRQQPPGEGARTRDNVGELNTE